MKEIKTLVMNLGVIELLELQKLVNSRVQEIRDSLPILSGDGSRHDKPAMDAYNSGKPVLSMAGDVLVKNSLL